MTPLEGTPFSVPDTTPWHCQESASQPVWGNCTPGTHMKARLDPISYIIVFRKHTGSLSYHKDRHFGRGKPSVHNFAGGKKPCGLWRPHPGLAKLRASSERHFC